MRLYEGMFLVDNAEARKDFDSVSKHVASIITKYGGEVKRSERWAERKLAYTIRRRDRGTYILVYFNASPESIVQIKRDCVIDEVIFRTMILRASAMPEEKAKPEPAKVPQKETEPAPPVKQETPAAVSAEPVAEDAADAAEEAVEPQVGEQAPEEPQEVVVVPEESAEPQGEERAAEESPEVALPPEGSEPEQAGATDEKSEGELTGGQAGQVEEVP